MLREKEAEGGNRKSTFRWQVGEEVLLKETGEGSLRGRRRIRITRCHEPEKQCLPVGWSAQYQQGSETSNGRDRAFGSGSYVISRTRCLGSHQQAEYIGVCQAS